MNAIAPDASRFRLLFVDDEARITRALKALFREHECYVTNDPREAAKLAREHDIDVVICDQRMPQMLGAECLREIRQANPRTMRILLTGYSDLKAVLGSVNEGEVFRFVNKPWDNRELREITLLAAQISRDSPTISDAPISEIEHEAARRQVGVLVIEDDPAVQHRLREILAPHYQVRFAASADRALQILEEYETGVVISETASSQGDLTGLLKALKQYHPHIATVIITERANAQTAIDLINEGQVYRMLLKPVRLGSTRLSVDAALGRYWKLKQTPTATRRFTVSAPSVAMAKIGDALLARIRAIPGRLVHIARFSAL